MKKNKSGFTLIELIVVVAILVALLLMLVPKLTGFTETAADAAALNNLKQIEKAFAAADVKARLENNYHIQINVGRPQQIFIPYVKINTAVDQSYEIEVTRLVDEMLGPEMEDKYIIFLNGGNEGDEGFIFTYYPNKKFNFPYYRNENGEYQKCTAADSCEFLKFETK